MNRTLLTLIMLMYADKGMRVSAQDNWHTDLTDFTDKRIYVR